ncbi:MAG: hypothetical protein ACOC5T_00625 [Elusimicrobiota bacterium]
MRPKIQKLEEVIEENQDYKRANEILYLFKAASNLGWQDISKIGVQKTIYLSEILAPFKNVVLSFLNFIYHYKGPYSKDIQNSLDYLVSCGALEITKFVQYGKVTYVNYKISESGKKIVEALLNYNEEREKYDWMIIVLKLIDAYKEAFRIGKDYKDVDKIIDLVYEDPSFKFAKKKGRGEFVRMDTENNATLKFLKFLKEIEERKLPKILKRKPTDDIETIMLMFFEYLYLEFLKSHEV